MEDTFIGNNHLSELYKKVKSVQSRFFKEMYSE